MSEQEDKKIPIVVRITDTVTQEKRNYKDTLYTTENYDGIFIWAEGNYSCDCNRKAFFERAMNEPKSSADEYPCGDGRYKVEITRENDGTLIYSD
jgi:hypothetical protein